MSEVAADLKSEVLIARLMEDWKPWDVGSRRCSKIRDLGSAVINDVTSK